MKVMKYILPFLTVAMLAVLTGCPDADPPRHPVTGMTVRLGANIVQPNEELFIEEGGRLNLTVALEPAAITGTITWSPTDNANLGIETSNEGANAALEGLAPADEPIAVTVSARNNDNTSPVTLTFYVRVVPEGAIPILGISIVGVPDGGALSIFDGEERTLRLALMPFGVRGTVSVTPSGSAFLDTDSADGTVTLTGTGVGGPLNITVSATNDNTVTPVSTSFSLTVLELPPPPAQWFQRRHNNFDGAQIRALAFDETSGRFFGGSDDGRVGVSDNSMVWTGITTGFSPHVRGFAYGNGRIVAALQSLPSLAVSPDGGTTWTHPSTVITGFLAMGSDGGNLFVAGGFSGQIGFSENGGVTWWQGEMAPLANVRGIAIGDGIVVAVGDPVAGSNPIGMAFSENNGRTWTAGTHSAGTTGNIMEVAFGRGRFVATGDGGHVSWSADGRNWVPAENTGGLSGSIRGLTYGNGYFIAGGSGGSIAWSTDGSNWTEAVTPSGVSTVIEAIAWGGDKWVAVGTNGVIFFSGGLDTVENPIMAMEVVNADTNVTITEGTSFRLREGSAMNLAVTIDSDEIVADGGRITGTVTWVSDSNAVTITQTPGTYGTEAVITAAVRGNAYITISAQNDYNAEPVYLTFDITVLGDEDPFPVESITLRDGTVTIVDGGSLTLDLAQARTFSVELYPTGVEGDITWSAGNAAVSVVPGEYGMSGTITGLTAGGSLAVTVTAENIETPEPVTMTFTVNVIMAPVAWNPSVSGADIFGAIGGDGQSATGVAFGNGVWVAGGSNFNGLIGSAAAGDARLAWSIDGRNWTRAANDTIVVCPAIRSVNFIRELGESGLFIAGGSTGRLFTSADGQTWTAMNDNQQIPGLGVGVVSSMTYANGRLFSTNTGAPRASFSDDGGVTWTGVIPAADGGAGLWDSAYGNGVWVAVGNPGIIRHSTNLTDWTLATHPANVNLQGVAFGNGRFVVVGFGGNIVWSYDAVTWTSTPSGVTANLNGLTFANGYFVAVGDSNTIRISADGVNWTAGTTPGANNAINPNLRDVAFGNNLWVVGGRGANLRFSDVTPAP